MGITNDLFPQESAFAVTPEQMRLCDPFSDPEDIRDPRSQRRGIDNFASFMRFLAPVERGNMDDQVRAGEQIFAAIGCTACHIPALETGPSSNPLFHRKRVALFSDLAPPRRRDRRRHQARGRGDERNPHARAVGVALQAATVARRNRDGRRSDRQARAGSRTRTKRVRTSERDRSSRIARLSGLAVATRRND